MSLPAIGTLGRAAWRLKRLFAPKAIILMYHGVAEVGSDPWGLSVTPAHFAEQLEVLQNYAQPIRLQELIRAHHEGNIPWRAVVITFDDGYANNLHHAKPLLEHYNIPATVFVTTGHIGNDREFWWDELDRLLLQPGTLPGILRLKINGRDYKWELGQACYGTEEWQHHRQRRAWEGLPGSRYELYYSLWQRLLPLPESERRGILDEIAIWSKAEQMARSTHRSLFPAEVLTLAREDLIEIGAHTVTHPFLSAHPLSCQQIEILRSKAYLEELLGHSITSFSYPHGDYTVETIALIREAGFTCACTVEAKIAWQQSDCYQLPRFQVYNWNGDKFAKQFLRWFHT
jgi:peptidoglycan/xylan/chitin deacetylase (PgdA/CDA1 family)